MKKQMILSLILVLTISFIINSVSAECQYKENIGSGVFINNLYDYDGHVYTDPIDISSISRVFPSPGVCLAYMSIKNNIDKNITIKLQYQVTYNNRIYFEKELSLLPLQILLVSDSISSSVECNIVPDSISYQFITNNETIAKIEEEMNQTCKQCGSYVCLNDGDLCTYDFECGSNVCSDSGNTIGHCISPGSDFDIRLSGLESWKQTIDDWKDSITIQLSDLLLSLTGLTTGLESQSETIDSQNLRISQLESSFVPNQSEQTFPDYLQYLSSSDRKKIVCGYAEDNRIEYIEDLGWSCDLTYKTYSSGRERVSCRCKGL